MRRACYTALTAIFVGGTAATGGTLGAAAVSIAKPEHNTAQEQPNDPPAIISIMGGSALAVAAPRVKSPVKDAKQVLVQVK
ncbi:hypothetical protein BV898_17310 [Hypsibius exemplaris]|uniref:Uncharacterized protein n=1 Tax=Hypsibius exemplaris TaxID=2072580 RepID=A0A9X6NHG1_HYPEX|nr:hypothetical protein BV898_17310 [Hypsibius exemplaris]